MKHILRFNTVNENLSIKDLKVGQEVKYKQNGYDNSKGSKEQEGLIEKKPIERIDVSKGLIFFKDHEDKEFFKNISDIIVDEKEDTIDKLKSDLGQLKSDKNKMNQMLTYADFLIKK